MVFWQPIVSYSGCPRSFFALPFVEIGGYRIEYFVIRGKSKRYTYFRIGSDMRLEIVIPEGRAVDIHSAIRSRERWILRRFQQFDGDPKIFDKNTVMYEGRALSLVFEKSFEKEELKLDPIREQVIVRASDSSRTPELIRRWFIYETSKYVIKRLGELSMRTSVRYKRADVRQMKNWGYCTRDGKLSFSWQLIALPELLRDYVIMHELVHLTEFNHSTAFKKRLAELCPDYRKREDALSRILPGSLAGHLD